MVIETFYPGRKADIYERFSSCGRMLPDGLVYIDSWLEKDGGRCFQLMETEDPSTLASWVEHWEDMIDFEIVEIGSTPV